MLDESWDVVVIITVVNVQESIRFGILPMLLIVDIDLIGEIGLIARIVG